MPTTAPTATATTTVPAATTSTRTTANTASYSTTATSNSQHHSPAALGGEQNICETDVGAVNGQGEKKAWREEKKAGRKRAPEAELITVLTEAPKTTKKKG